MVNTMRRSTTERSVDDDVEMVHVINPMNVMNRVNQDKVN